MGELMINRQRELAAARLQKESRTVKKSSVGQAHDAGRTAGTDRTAGMGKNAISVSLRHAITTLDQAAGARRQLISQEGALAEAQDTLDRMAKLARQAAEGGGGAELQPKLEELLGKLDQVLKGTAGDEPMFTEEDLQVFEGLADDLSALLASGGSQENLLDSLQQLLADNIPLDQALQQLLAGGLLPDSALLDMLPDGAGMYLLLNALTASQPPEAAPQAENLPMQQFGSLQVSGQELAGVEYDAAADLVRVGGEGDVTLRGQTGGDSAQVLTADGQPRQTAQTGSAPSILLSGSGDVALENVKSPAVTVDAQEARLSSHGENELGELRMKNGASVTMEGDGHVKISTLRGDASNTVKVSGGAVTVKDGAAGSDVHVVVDGAASLAAQPQMVVSPEGARAEPFDILWKSLLPGWKEIGSITVDGKTARMALFHDEAGLDPARLWLERGDRPLPQQPPVHAVTIRGKDQAGQAGARSVWLRWDQRSQAFLEVLMYPNPFAVTGGSQGVDWSYEYETQTLRIFTEQVTHVSGGAGLDLEGNPFSGRLALEHNLGETVLTLGGVDCRVSEGKAFDLGNGNDVTLILQSGSRNTFSSGEGFAGISLGSGTNLTIDREPEPEPEPEDEEEGEAGESADDILDTLLSGNLDLVLNAGVDMLLNAGLYGEEEDELAEDAEPAEDAEKDAAPALPAGILSASGGDGGAGIGRDRGESRDRTSRITIRGGTVTAVGSGGGAGIGSGKYCFMGQVVITGGNITAVGGNGGAGIGGALSAPVGDIIIEGGTISATATYHAAAIGAGVEGACGQILIGGGAQIVKAEGGDPEASIGACRFGKCGEIHIQDGADIGAANTRPWEPESSAVLVDSDLLTLPRFEITPRMLRLKNLDLQTFESALAAEGKIDSASRYVSLIQDVYRVLSGKMDQSPGEPVRDAGAAAELLANAKQPILHSAPEAFAAGGARDPDDILRLLRQTP